MIKLFKKLVGFIAIFALAGTAFAATPNDSSMDTLYVTDVANSTSNWGSAATISADESLFLELHYYLANNEHADNMRFIIENLDNRTFNAGDNENITGSITASNLNTTSGSVNVNFTDDVRLEFVDTSWQAWNPNSCASKSCESNPVDSDNAVLTSQGMNIGNVTGYTNGNWQGTHYTGNVIIEFKAVSINDDDDDLDIDTNSATDIDDDSAKLRGEVSGPDNVKVWFVYSESDSTPECDGNDEEVYLSGSYDDGDDFSKTITGLDAGTTYYFRACGEKGSDDDAGYTRSFTTDDNTQSLDIDTNSATDIDDDSAKLRGEVSGPDNVKVWFVYSESDSTPECDGNDEEVYLSGSYDDGDDFSKTITGLDAGTTYYFRACGEKGSDDDAGYTRSFTTDSKSNSTKSVLTNTVSSLTTSAATLHSININRNGNVLDSFEYGRTYSLGSKTTPVTINASSYSKRIYGLTANTTYYYRAVMVDDGITYKGVIKSFKTGRSSIIVDPQDDDDDDKIIVVIKETTNLNDLILNKWVSQEKSSGYVLSINAQPNDIVYYKVRITNSTTEDMEDITVTDHIPYYLELNGETNTDDNADKYLTWEIDELKAGRSRVFITEMKIAADTPEDIIITSKARVVQNNETEYTNDVIIDLENEIIDNSNRQTASIFGAGSTFFPDSMSGWMLLLVIILLIAFLIYKIFAIKATTAQTIAALKATETGKIG